MTPRRLRPGDLVFYEEEVSLVVSSKLHTRVWTDYSVFPAVQRLRPSQERCAFYELFADCTAWTQNFM